MTNNSTPPSPRRRVNGTFAAGESGNKKGRPRRKNTQIHPETIRDYVYDVCEHEVMITINGKPRKLTLFEANLLTLAVEGAKGNARSADKFIGVVEGAAREERDAMNQLLARISKGTPAWMEETDPVRRAQLKKGWDYAVAEAMGRRPRTTSGLVRRRERKPRSRK